MPRIHSLALILGLFAVVPAHAGLQSLSFTAQRDNTGISCDDFGKDLAQQLTREAGVPVFDITALPYSGRNSAVCSIQIRYAAAQALRIESISLKGRGID